MTAPDRLPVVLIERHDSNARDRALIVKNPNGEHIRVRWRLGRAAPWRCDLHGPQAAATCPEVFAAAVMLASRLLGLGSAAASSQSSTAE